MSSDQRVRIIPPTTKKDRYVIYREGEDGTKTIEEIAELPVRDFSQLPTITRRTFMGISMAGVAAAYAKWGLPHAHRLQQAVEVHEDLTTKAAEITDHARRLLGHYTALETRLEELEADSRIDQEVLTEFQRMYEHQRRIGVITQDALQKYSTFNHRMNEFARETGIKKLEDTPLYSVPSAIYEFMQKTITGRDVSTQEYKDQFEAIRITQNELLDSIHTIQELIDKEQNPQRIEKLMTDYTHLVRAKIELTSTVREQGIGKLLMEDITSTTQELEELIGPDFRSYLEEEKKYKLSQSIPYVAGALVLAAAATPLQYIAKMVGGLTRAGTRVAEHKQHVSRREFLKSITGRYQEAHIDD
jgi:hypothetical protein